MVSRPSDNTDSSPTIDACSFTSLDLFLLADNHVICKSNTGNDNKYRVSNNVKIKRIFPYAGFLHGLSDQGVIYSLPNDFLERTSWLWQPATRLVPAVGAITHVSTTHDGNCLWLQVGSPQGASSLQQAQAPVSRGYLYQNYDIVETIDVIGQRIYGRTRQHYVDLNGGTALISNSGSSRVNGVRYALLDFNDKLLSIPSGDTELESIVLVGWQPYYLRSIR